jgi:GTP cyclohydrolase II
MNPEPTAQALDGPLPNATVRTEVRIPLRFTDGFQADAHAFTFHGLIDKREHLAFRLGAYHEEVPLVRIHSECLTGDVFGSARCDCGPQLRKAAEALSNAGGLLALQDQGLDTFEANTALGFPADARNYAAAAQIRRALGVLQIRLLSNNPDKAVQLAQHGVTIHDQVPTGVFVTTSNQRYPQAKKTVIGHRIALETAHVTPSPRRRGTDLDQLGVNQADHQVADEWVPTARFPRGARRIALSKPMKSGHRRESMRMRKLAATAVGTLALGTLGLPATTANATDYPTVSYRIDYGATYSAGTVTFYNRSLKIVGGDHSVSASDCRATSASEYPNPENLAFSNGICNGNETWTLNLDDDVPGGPSYAYICLDAFNPGYTITHHVKCDYVFRP